MAAVLALVLVSGVLVSGAKAGTVAFVDFDNLPAWVIGDGTAAPPVVVPGIATFTGGIVGSAASSFFPPNSFSTPPNQFVTIDYDDFFASEAEKPVPNLPDLLTITVNPSFAVNEVSFPVYNEYEADIVPTMSFVVDAFHGSTQIAQQTFNDLVGFSNTPGGFGVVDLKATGITSVTVTLAPTIFNDPDDVEWGYGIDSVAFNESVSSAITPEGHLLPLPSAGWSSAGMLAVLGLIYIVRSRRQHAVV
jgi:hypothetical protein